MENLLKCSVVLSVYNEERNLVEMYRRLDEVSQREKLEWEFIFVDDGSKDRSFDVLKDLHAKDSRVKIIKFSRNFGAHETTAAGLGAATGEVAIIMSSDLQDPPEVVHRFLEQWRAGVHVVWGVRASRDEPLVRRFLARMFYRILRRVMPDYPRHGTGSFCLISRQVIDVFNSLSERNRVTFGLIMWSGFRQAEVPYDRPMRLEGKSSWSFARQIKAAVDTILGFSYGPIRLISYVGIGVSLASFLLGFWIIWHWFAHGTQQPGWASIMVSVLFLGGVQLVALGILGEYLWRALEESRGRPLYVIEDVVGDFSRDGSSAPRSASVASYPRADAKHPRTSDVRNVT